MDNLCGWNSSLLYGLIKYELWITMFGLRIHVLLDGDKNILLTHQ